MAGHSKFKNIQHRKNAQDKKRGKMFTRLVRDIFVAAKSGLPDPNSNPKLRAAIAAAKIANLPKDRIDNAIDKASNPQNTSNYEDIRYEGYAPGGIAIIVEALTDNRNRTASEVRSAFTRHGGTLGETGSVSFMFNKLGTVVYSLKVTDYDNMMEAAIEIGADDVVIKTNSYHIICQPENLSSITEALEAKFGKARESEILWLANEPMPVDEDRGVKLLALIESLEDSDDVQSVAGNFTLPDSLNESDDED
jgi:YebC/PmpR family DNA-binding regulatory protein